MSESKELIDRLRGVAERNSLTENVSLYIEAADALDAIRAQEPVTTLPFTILKDELKDLRRFTECADDGEGYDVPKARMKRLAEIGLLRRVSANYYEHTAFGLAVLKTTSPTHPTAQPVLLSWSVSWMLRWLKQEPMRLRVLGVPLITYEGEETTALYLEDQSSGWINPNDKTQKQYLPHIGEKVLFCHKGQIYIGKHTGGSFKAMTPPFAHFGTWDCHWMYPPKPIQD